VTIARASKIVKRFPADYERKWNSWDCRGRVYGLFVLVRQRGAAPTVNGSVETDVPRRIEPERGATSILTSS